MSDLISEYNNKIDEKREIMKKIDFLKEDTKVKLYISLEEEYNRINKDINDLFRLLINKRFSDCNHIFVYTSTDYDNKDENYKRPCGCIKCGLDTGVLYKDVSSLDSDELIMLEFLKENKLSNGIYTGILSDLPLATSIYQRLVMTNPDVTDDEVIKELRNCLVPKSNIKHWDDRYLPRIRRKFNQ